MVQLNTDKEEIRTVVLDKTGMKSFGICIVRGEVKDSPNTKTTGIFIKSIVPQSPAHLCGKLKVGDRILSLNDNDVRNASEEAVIDLIKDSGMIITLQIQTFEHNEPTKTFPIENGFVQSRTKSIREASQSANATLGRQPTSRKPPSAKDMLRTAPGTLPLAGKTTSRPDDDDDEDTRDMTGRIRTAAGYEIDRASAGNCKLNSEEKKRDKEEDDEFGYTMAKISKRYNLKRDLRRIEVSRAPNESLGLALAGHRDRQKMACFVAGINPKGPLASVDILAGDEILEVNGKVLLHRSHLNASVIFKNIAEEKIVLVTSRRKANEEGISVKAIKKFPELVDDTKFLFEQFPKARAVQVKKEGFLGIMVIYGKHVEVGNGIFVSDLREESNAALAGIKVGDMLLAVNKDVTMESNYDEAVALIKRAEGIVTLVVLTLKAEEPASKDKKAGTGDTTDGQKAEEKKEKVEPEKPADPATVEIKPNTKMIIEVKIEKKPLGVIVVGGKNNYVKTGCVITHIYPEGALAADKRLKIFDQIIEFNSVQMHCEDMTTLKVHQKFHVSYDNTISLLVYRADPPEVDKFGLEFMKKAGKELGLSLAPNEKGCTVCEITSSGYADIENKLQRGDIITKFNGQSLENTTFEECFALFKTATGKISLEVSRPKPTCRTEAPKR